MNLLACILVVASSQAGAQLCGDSLELPTELVAYTVWQESMNVAISIDCPMNRAPLFVTNFPLDVEQDKAQNMARGACCIYYTNDIGTVITFEHTVQGMCNGEIRLPCSPMTGDAMGLLRYTISLQDVLDAIDTAGGFIIFLHRAFENPAALALGP
eukprot:gene4699-4882_t